MKMYGAPEDWLVELRASLIDMGDVSTQDERDKFDNVIKLWEEMLEQEGKLARGEIKIFVEPGVSDLHYKSAFFHELTHAFDPKVHLPHRIRGEQDFYIVDPVELDASINEFAVVAEEFPDEFNTEAKDIIRRGAKENDFKILVTKYSQNLERRGIDSGKLLLYLEKLLTLHARIKRSSLRGVVGEKSRNKFMLKLMNILEKPKEQSSKSLRDRLSDYKGSKKRDESQGFWDTPPPLPARNNKGVLSADDVDNTEILEILEYLYDSLNDLFIEGKRVPGGIAGTNFLKDLPELRNMCKALKSSVIGDLSAGEVIVVVYTVAFMLVNDKNRLRYQFMRLVNAPIKIDDSLMAKILKVAIGMGWDDSRSFNEQ